VSENSFRAHGVSPEVDQALAARNITSSLPHSIARPRRRARRHRRAGEVADRSGKTLAFALPIVARIRSSATPSALVLVPTRELALQVCDEIAVVAAPKS
jgi:superfamily II DNA/RNA helicase